jgi:fatty-acyl-CoA synthase
LLKQSGKEGIITLDIWMTLKKAVDFYPDKKAVVDGDQSFTYAQTYERVAALARFFQARGIEPEDRISILEVNSHAYLETYYAAAGIGAVLNPLNYRLASREIAYILRDSGSRWLIANRRFAAQVQGLFEEDTPLEGIVWIGGAAAGPAKIACHEYEGPSTPTKAGLNRSRSGKTALPIFTTPAAPPAGPRASSSPTKMSVCMPWEPLPN